MSYDERAALAALEALQRELEASRRRREQANAAFSRFLGGVGEHPAAPSRPGRGAAARAIGVGMLTAPAPAAPRSPVVPAALVPAPRNRHAEWVAAALTVAALGAVLAFGLLWSGRSDEAAPQAAATPAPHGVAPASAPAAAGEAGAARPAETVPTAPARGTELLTLRRVWLRVTVDGRRIVERELDGGQTIPLQGLRGAVAVRAGDGGAVRFYLRGEDQGPLGPDGRVVTRTFTIE